MSNIETNLQNAFETTLTTGMSASDLSAIVASMGSPSLASPCYLVIDPDNDEKREYILFDGTFGALTFVASNINKRYLTGSAYGSNITHDIGAVVSLVPVAQHFEDLNDRVDNIDHGDLSGLGDDDHTQYLKSATHAADDHSALAIDADMVDGQHANEFAADDHDHTGVYAPDAHVDSRDGHPLVTVSLDGLMSSEDKTILDALEGASGGIQGVTAGAGIDVSGTSVIEVSHEDNSSAVNINNATNEHIDTLTFDTFGHVTAATKQVMDAADIGASPSGHDHAGTYTVASHPSSADHDTRYDSKYYGRATIDGLLAPKALLANFYISGGFAKVNNGSGDVFTSNGTDQLYIKGLPHTNVQYDVRCTDEGTNTRRLYYYDDSSTERAKHDIEPSPLQGGETLKWDMYQFRKDLEGDEGPIHQWTIAERIYETSGEDFVVRDEEGLIQNTDDRAMMADMILTIQRLEARITELEAK